MKRLTVLAVLFLLASMSLAVTSATAASTVWTSDWDKSYGSPAVGQVINKVGITSNADFYSINMLLNAVPVVGTTYSVLMSTNPNSVFSYPGYSADAIAALTRGGSLSVSFAADNLVTNTPLDVTHSWNGNSLTWILAKNDLFSGASFWFAGQSYKTGDLNTLYSETKVAATPIPGAAWLLGSGILGMVALRRRNQAA